MANYFQLILDTTPPELTLQAPATVVLGQPAALGFVADEEIAAASCWLIDATGARTDLDLIYQDGAWLGSFTFTAETLGICTLYAQATDTVGNESGVAQLEFQASDQIGGRAEIAADVLIVALEADALAATLGGWDPYDVDLIAEIPWILIGADVQKVEVTKD